MSHESQPANSRERLLEQAIAAYYQASEAGQEPDREAFLARYPELADELRSFFADQKQLARFAAALPAATPGAEAPTLAPDLPAADSSLGTVRYFGDYELLEEIARGGMGVVYRARQMSLNRIVALKMILAGELASPEEVRRFRSEAEAAASLDHANIVPIYEVGEHQGQHYFSMKLIEGGSLAQLFSSISERRTGGRASLPDAAKVVATVARAVHYAHQRGILHRDLKPANILLDAAGQPHVSDFGLARRVAGESKLTQSGAIVGTPAYMPPEQARAEKRLSVAVDVYSLGAILYEWLTGRPPFQAATQLDTILQLLEQQPQPPRSLNPQVPRDLETICLKCLEKEPQRRYGSAEALADDLERWQRGEPITARPAGTVERAVKWVRRRPAVAALLAALVLVTALGFAGVWWKYLDAEEQADIAGKERVRAEGQTRLALQEAENARRQENIANNKSAEANNQAQIAKKQKEEAQRQQRLAVRSLANSYVQLAAAAWREGKVALALHRLEEVPEDLRFWDWRYLRRQCEGSLFTLYGHTNGVSQVAYSPDGKSIVSLGGTLIVWDARTGREKWSVPNVMGMPVSSVAFSPDSKILAGNVNLVIKFWDAQTGKEVGTTNEIGGSPLAYSPDGKSLAGGGFGGTLRVFDVGTRKEIFSVNASGKGAAGVQNVAFSPDGKLLAAGGDDFIRVWDWRAGKEVLSLQGPSFRVENLAFSPDGKRLLGGVLSRLKAWDTASGKEQFSLELDGYHPVLSPDGERMAGAGREGAVHVWDVRTGKEKMVFRGHVHWVNCVAFSPDGQFLVSGGGDHTVKVWDLRSPQGSLLLTDAPNTLAGAAFSPDSKLVAGGSSFFDTRWSWYTGGGVKVWDPRTGEVRATLAGQRGEMTSVAFSPDGTLVAGASWGATVKVWDLAAGREVFSLEGHKGRVLAVAFSPNGKRMVSLEDGGADADGGALPGRARMWDANTGKELFTCPGGVANEACVAFMPDGRYFAYASGSQIRVMEAETGKKCFTLKGDFGGVQGLACSPDGRRLACARFGGRVELWDLEQRKQIFSLKGHTHQPRMMTGVAFSPDGERIASSDLEEIKVWDAVTAQEVLSLKGKSWLGKGAPAFSPDGRFLAWSDYDGLRVWDTHLPQKTYPAAGDTVRPQKAILSPDGRLLATVLPKLGQPATIKVWDVQTGKTAFSLTAHTKDISSLAVHSEGKRLAVVGLYEPAVRLWDLGAGKVIRTLKGRGAHVRQMAFSPSGKHLAASYHGGYDKDARQLPGNLTIWEVASGDEVHVLKANAEHLTYSTDGKRLAAAIGSEGKVWDAVTGKELAVFKGHKYRVDGIGFSADGKRVITTNAAETFGWDAQTGKQLPGVFRLADSFLRHDIDAVDVDYWVDLRLSEEELDRRRRFTRRDPFWHASETERHARNRHWFAAAFHARWAFHGGPGDAVHWRRLALCQAAAGERDEYRKSCAELLRRVAPGVEPVDVVQMLAPDSLLSRVLFTGAPLADRSVLMRACLLRSEPGDLKLLLRIPANDVFRGMILSRAGKYQEALTLLGASEEPVPLLHRALAEQGRGKPGEAKKLLAQLAKWLKEAHPMDRERTNADRLSWEERLEIDVLRDEVESLLKSEKPAAKL
jgi:WD40 repeat protein